VERLRFIRRCRGLDFAISNIRSLLVSIDPQKEGCGQVRKTTAAHLADIRGRIEDLHDMERILMGLVTQCDANTSPGCPTLVSLSA